MRTTGPGIFFLKRDLSLRQRRTFLAFAVVFVLIVFLRFVNPADSSLPGAPETKSQENLKRIFDEVKEMGPYPGENFILREFFTGNDDDDDTNKDNHVAILIQAVAPREKMKIQVTTMVPSEGNPRIKIAKSTKTIICFAERGEISLFSSDYEEKELAKTAAEILQAVVSKKRLLRENGIR